ncbi:MAG: hypothetical protein M2R45_01523 [Verrucomicrobia subdivision 3 bacterium]|nr:hypothetical protein [Limisphaerales bacterium]MCS1413349.1 hypothetical protein [Limisphaerales bacterium]
MHPPFIITLAGEGPTGPAILLPAREYRCFVESLCNFTLRGSGVVFALPDSSAWAMAQYLADMTHFLATKLTCLDYQAALLPAVKARLA